jgi:adenylate kinase family enzyme
MRIAILGNSGGGKSTLARRLAKRHRLPLHELDRLLWRPGWTLAPEDAYAAEHTRIVAEDAWVLDGSGRLDSVEPRIQRATLVILVDMPVWQHFWLAAERQIAWATGELAERPAGLAHMPPTRALFETIWMLDRDWLPTIRERPAERGGTDVRRIASPEELAVFEI